MYDTEQEMEKVVLETEHQFEQEIMDYWLSSKQYYTAGDGESTTSSSTSDTTTTTIYEADVRMQQQSSKWVDEEKKLKQALQVLVDRQYGDTQIQSPFLTIH